jgi:hypothetical protein
VVIIPVSYLPAYSPSIILETETHYIEVHFVFGGKRMKANISMIRKDLYHKYHEQLNIGTLICFMSANIDTVIKNDVSNEELHSLLKGARVIGVQ